MKALLLALPLFVAASPAFATGSIFCRTIDGSEIGLSGAIGRTITSPLVSAVLEVEGRVLSTNDPDPGIAIGRSWIDRTEIRIDLVDPNVERFEAQLRARFRGEEAIGTIERGGRTHPVRCEFE